MFKLYAFVTLIIIYASYIVSSQSNNHKNNNNIPPLHDNNRINSKINSPNQHHPIDHTESNINYPQKLTVIGYASDKGPARHLTSFAKKYNLDLHLIGLDKPWGGFNDKISGFHSFIKSIDNKHNNSIILILDSYDTVPICSEQDLLNKFNSFNSDIVMSTGKDCWPDPNVGDFLTNRLTEKELNEHKFFPWFLCPNSGAIMGKHDEMLSMFERVQQLVTIGNGSCHDFEGNKFSKHTQSDQRCYTTYYVELTKFNEYLNLINNKSYTDNNIIDISKINNLEDLSSSDGSISKDYIHLHYNEYHKYYKNIKMTLDYTNNIFLSMGGMMFMDINIDFKKDNHIVAKSKITNGTACIIHGNGPGVILWRSFVKQIKNNGNLYIDDYVLRVGVDFFHWILWWIIMPLERLSHWLSITYKMDLGVHSSTFSEELIWRFHVWTFVAVIIMLGLPLLYWYKYKFIKTMKINQMNKNIKNNIKKSDDNLLLSHNTHLTNNKNKRKSIKKYHPIAQQLLANLEIMVHHNGNAFPLLKTQKKS